MKKIDNKIKRGDALDIFCKYFDRKSWEHNFDDVLYYMEFWEKSVKITTSKIGNIISISVISKNIKKVVNFNNNILYQFLIDEGYTISDVEQEIEERKFIDTLPYDKYILFESFINRWNKFFKDKPLYNKYMRVLYNNKYENDREILYKNKKLHKIKFFVI